MEKFSRDSNISLSFAYVNANTNFSFVPRSYDTKKQLTL